MAAGDLITTTGQIEWGGALLGSGTVYRWLELTGWEDMPGLDRGNVPRPSQHGAYPGKSYAQERIITWDARISTLPALFGAAVTALRRITAIDDGDVDQPLVIRTRGGETRLAYARVAQRTIPNTPQAGIGRGTAAIQWVCADPRLYSVTEHSTAIPRPTSGSGLVYPLTYPLSYGTAGDTGSRPILNAGDAAASPVVAITGPCTTPAVVNITTGQAIELDLTLAATETVLIDTDAGTVLLASADRLYALTGRSVPPELFVLPPGTSEIAYRAAVATSTSSCTITWRDAYL